MHTLFINACVRENSRTLLLAQHLLHKLGGEIEAVDLPAQNIQPLDSPALAERERLIRQKSYTAPKLQYARRFAVADVVVIAAPFWDLSFPALLKNYLEAITVSGGPLPMWRTGRRDFAAQKSSTS